MRNPLVSLRERFERRAVKRLVAEFRRDPVLFNVIFEGMSRFNSAMSVAEIEKTMKDCEAVATRMKSALEEKNQQQAFEAMMKRGRTEFLNA